MDDKRRLFYISGFFSLLLFSLLFSLFLYLLFKPKKVQIYGLTKKNYISISLNQTSTKAKKQLKKAVSRPKVSKQKKQVKKKRDSVDSVDDEIDVDSLFNNIWTKKVDTRLPKRRKLDAKRIAEIEKTLNSPQSLHTASKSKNVRNEKKKSTQAVSSGEEVNEYSAKIHAIVYDNFFPPKNSEGEQVKAVIELSALGKVLDFRIITYSGNEMLNEEVDRIKERIKNIIFPKNPSNKSARIIVILKPEAKE